MDYETILRSHDVVRLLNVSRSSLYAWMRAGSFPKPVKLGERAVGWRVSTINAWIETRQGGGEK